MIQTLLLILHIFVCFFLIIVVLMQSGKSADLAGAFGGYGSQSTFGPRGTATLLSKITTTLAVLFMISSLLLWIGSTRKAQSPSVLGKESGRTEQKSQRNAPKSVPPPVEKTNVPDQK